MATARSAKPAFVESATALISTTAADIDSDDVEDGSMLGDFGSGLSSFGYLKNLPVDYLKIDGLFIRDIADNNINFAMVKSINEIGQVMGKKTVAEFVENDAILDKLHDIGVDFAQGYGIGKPVPIAKLASGVARPATH